MQPTDRETLSHQTGKKVIIKRTFDAPCELVWEAWTSPALLAKWFSARKEVKMKVLELDLRTGGRFRFVFSNRDGSFGPGEYTGTYTLVNPPARLSFKVVDFSNTKDPAGVTAYFEIELTRIGKQTQVALTATLPEEKYIAGTITGWNSCFDNLAEMINQEAI